MNAACELCGGERSDRTKTQWCHSCNAREQLRVGAPLGGLARARAAGQHVFEDIPAEQLATIAKRYRDGDSSAELAFAFGISDQTVRNWLRRMGVDLRSKGRPRRTGGGKRTEYSRDYYRRVRRHGRRIGRVITDLQHALACLTDEMNHAERSGPSGLRSQAVAHIRQALLALNAPTEAADDKR